jgi:hypothetical protein
MGALVKLYINLYVFIIVFFNFNIDTVSNKTIIIVIYLFTEEIYFKMLNQ